MRWPQLDRLMDAAHRRLWLWDAAVVTMFLVALGIGLLIGTLVTQ